MAQKYRVVLIVILYCIDLSLCQGTQQEFSAREEYVQTFNSIPKLFEYLLDVLEKRPEILENNSNSAFMESDIQRDKRENDVQAVDKETSNEGTDKDEGGDVNKVTERHEYGNSIEKLKRSKKSSIIPENKDDDKSINKALNNVDVANIKRSNNFGESYFGSTNTMSKVSPGEVEEMALKVEKEIEEHVKNRQKKDLK